MYRLTVKGSKEIKFFLVDFKKQNFYASAAVLLIKKPPTSLAS